MAIRHGTTGITSGCMSTSPPASAEYIANTTDVFSGILRPGPMSASWPSETSWTGYPRRSSTTILSKKASKAAPGLLKADACPAGTQAKHACGMTRYDAQRPYQLGRRILIVRREPSFGCAGSPRQLHAGSVKVLFGAQQCTEYAISSFPTRRAGAARCADCGAIWCKAIAWSAVPADEWLGSAKSGGRPTSVWLLRSVQSRTSSASTTAVSACSRAISACSRSRLSESAEHNATLSSAGAGPAFAATERGKMEAATSRTPNAARTASRVDPGPRPHPGNRYNTATCHSAGLQLFLLHM